jgi:hypothetical protein
VSTDFDTLAQNQRDDLRGTSMGRRTFATGLPMLTPERDAVIHAKFQHLAKTGVWLADDAAQRTMEELRNG